MINNNLLAKHGIEANKVSRGRQKMRKFVFRNRKTDFGEATLNMLDEHRKITKLVKRLRIINKTPESTLLVA